MWTAWGSELTCMRKRTKTMMLSAGCCGVGQLVFYTHTPIHLQSIGLITPHLHLRAGIAWPHLPLPVSLLFQPLYPATCLASPSLLLSVFLFHWTALWVRLLLRSWQQRHWCHQAVKVQSFLRKVQYRIAIVFIVGLKVFLFCLKACSCLGPVNVHMTSQLAF